MLALGPQRLASGAGGGAPVDPNILFHDSFLVNPNSGVLSARVPQVKGDPAFPNHYPTSNGTIAPLMRISGGSMGQSATGTGAGYDNVLSPQIPNFLSTSFIWGTGSQPAVMGMYPYPGSGSPDALTGTKLIHLFMSTTALVPQMADASYFPNGNANYPMAWAGPASPFTLTVGQTYTLTYKLSGKWVLMELFNSVGTSISKAQAYDPRIPSLAGRGAFLAETFDNLMNYIEEWAKIIPAPNVPVFANTPVETYFPANVSPLVDSPYAGAGGPPAFISTGLVRVTANATLGAGAGFPIGSTVNGSIVRVCIDASAIGANGWIVAVVPTSPGAPMSALVPLTAVGRFVADIVVSGGNAASSVVVGGNGVGATTLDMKGLFEVLDGPTGFVNTGP